MPLAPSPVEETVERLLGSGRFREALELMVEAYGDRVYRLACAILRDEASAQDAAQEAFVRIWRALPAFRGESSLGTWVYAIARNQCLTHAHRQKVERERCQAIEQRRPPEARGAGRGFDLDGAIQGLPEQERRTLVLFYYEEKSYEQVAESLGLPLGTVKTHLHRARRRLRQALEQHKQGVSRGL